MPIPDIRYRAWFFPNYFARTPRIAFDNQRGHRTVTPLDKELKRSLEIEGEPYTLIIGPASMRLVERGKRKARVELAWKDLVSGEAALATALNASVKQQ
jgi:hypothetical protein